ncbi:hypothetical protein DSM106972_025330 [Dulcicalothrix desertica PCC 7102]|uniref:Uncharacterized protein n=1 Tax=Dulcicalothrix desertica PCC 7102 TaxID=232991 RepID=A0A433VMK2_9CYAN|nr:hypothetical protein [Dulcicalothrix desertica]RUT07272.1 hypothetical protein DSM106972_025330 [Dulcicalothrix desertica PCC 7102]TWH55524.1 hypothetical protein CAL7102_03668 [Dulcicalothrix desertica PCC 7102]
MELVNFDSKQEFVTKWRDDFSGNLLSDDWEVVQLGTNQSINVNNSELRLRSGITANAQTIIRTKKTFTIPCRVFFIYYLTQRIVNQSFVLEIVDSSGTNYARCVFNGTSNTAAIGQLANNSIAGTDSSMIMPGSNSYSMLEIDLSIDELKFMTKSVDVSAVRDIRTARNRKLPDPNLKYYIQIRVVNNSTPPASSTDLFLDSVLYQFCDLINVDVSTSKASLTPSESLPVIITSTANVSGSVSIGDAGQSVLVTSINLAANAIFTGSSNSANGRNNLTVTVVTSSPGTLYVDQSINSSTWVQYSGKDCVAGVNTFNIPLDISSYRIRYVNGSTAQTSFAIYTKTKI